MMIDFVTHVLAFPGVDAIVGNRVAWFERPQSAGFHCITLTGVSPGRDYTHDGADGLDGPTVQFDYWGPDPIVLNQLQTLVRAGMEAPSPITGLAVGSTLFWPAELTGFRTLDTEDLSDQVSIYRLSDDFQFHHQSI